MMIIAPALSLHMQMRVGPQLVMASQVLRASGSDLEAMIRAEVEANPALELVGDSEPRRIGLRRAGFEGFSGEDWDSVEDRQAAAQSGVERLAAQAAFLVERGDLPLALELLHALDERGYLGETLESIAGRTGADPLRLERILEALHQLEPPGVGARDVRECLLIQCAHLQAEGVDCTLPRRLLSEAWSEFVERRWSRAARKIGASPADVEAAAAFIARSLYPYPLALLGDASGGAAPLFPDFIIRRMDGGLPAYRLELPGEERCELRLSAQFERLMHASGSAALPLASQDRDWVGTQAELARQFIAALDQRWGTLRRVGEFLMAYQQDYFDCGPRGLKPITRAEVAEALGLHESTVSRAVSDKILQLPNGRLQPLSELFNASLPVKETIRTLLSRPGAPPSDREIAERLSSEGLHVSRRTVTKYREQLKIPNGHYRQ